MGLLSSLLVSLYSLIWLFFTSPPSLQSLTDYEGWLLLCRQITTKNKMETPLLTPRYQNKPQILALLWECLMDAAQLYAVHRSKADHRQRQFLSLEKCFSVCLPWIPLSR